MICRQPEAQGLYEPNYEHDSCGIGFIAQVKGIKSHDIVTDALEMLKNMSHRGGCGSDGISGDGAGIMIQKPHKFYKRVLHDEQTALPDEADYGAGLFFMPHDDGERKACKDLFEKIAAEEGQVFLCWRKPVTDRSGLGKVALESMPFIEQAFVGRGRNTSTESFERKLYVIRRRAEKEIYNLQGIKRQFYICSLSTKTVVYKGMLTASQMEGFYTDLKDPCVESALALVHSRYSTNTFPSWARAHPNRYIAHNGEFNTIRGNVNAMKIRQSNMFGGLFESYYEKIFPIIDENGSDSSMFDNCLEFLHLAGRSLPEAIMMMIPEPWVSNENLDDERKAFYEYNSCLMEAWDGPAAVVFTDGSSVGAVLDRNGLRPARYCLTDDGYVVLASETGVLNIPAEKIIKKDRLRPGKMLLVDTKRGSVVEDEILKQEYSALHPYREWLNEGIVELEKLSVEAITERQEMLPLLARQTAFGYTYEDMRFVLKPMAENAEESVGAMGIDYPLAVLSEKPQLLYSYFKQMFAQVTNPPIDALREELVTDTSVLIGMRSSILAPDASSCRMLKLKNPVIDNDELQKIVNIRAAGHKAIKIDILFEIEKGSGGLKIGIDRMLDAADSAVSEGFDILILSDKCMNDKNAAIPALLAVSGLHHHLIRNGNRHKASIVVETGEAREVHHFCLLLGYGAAAINPYLAFESLDEMIAVGLIQDINSGEAVKNVKKAVLKGIVKVLSKMGISTIQSYQGSQLFEAIGISSDVITKYFSGTPSRIEGMDLDDIAVETTVRHENAFKKTAPIIGLEAGGLNQWRKDGEYHMYNPETISNLQAACRNNDYSLYKEYSKSLDRQSQSACTVRGLFEFDFSGTPIALQEVEPVESILKRFKTGAMSYGSLSGEAHETLAVAMNRIGGKSNTGEGGEDSERYTACPGRDSKRSSIKQVASGRFGVTSEYLVNSDEIQIKMAQGAKPGEGGQLPASKVYPWIARTRHSIPGVELISPPPHHDIYSIEDLAQLIYDLKCANGKARISVKLVSEIGVGTIASGVAKGGADVILVSGHDGGTGAAPRTGIQHAGIPWELGLAETHQTLVLNGLRDKVLLETDGKLMTGRDVAIAALLGAQEFGFATAPLVALGCVMMRVCNLDSCPVGIATQNPELRKKFTGKPEHVVNFMHFIASELREWMADLGFRSLDEMVGRTDCLKMSDKNEHRKIKNIDLSKILTGEVYVPGKSVCPAGESAKQSIVIGELLNIAKPALMNEAKVFAECKISNTDRAVGTTLGSEVTKLYGSKGLPEDSVNIKFIGSAGQSFGAFIPKGITLELEGDANDYPGKGLSGGKIIIYPPGLSRFNAEENIIVGNAAFYGATGGEGYIRGAAGERFCVRNSGADIVVEGVGDHGCEYMTGGRVLVLGSAGRNFAAGMSGGVAYVYSEKQRDFIRNCNLNMVELEQLNDSRESEAVKEMLKKHLFFTNSTLADKILSNWSKSRYSIIKLIPKDYKKMLETIEAALREGLTREEAEAAAFEANAANKIKA